MWKGIKKVIQVTYLGGGGTEISMPEGRVKCSLKKLFFKKKTSNKQTNPSMV
jgi:hypothetical protein